MHTTQVLKADSVMKIETKKVVIFKISKRVRHPFILLGSNCTLEWAGASACGDSSTRWYEI